MLGPNGVDVRDERDSWQIAIEEAVHDWRLDRMTNVLNVDQFIPDEVFNYHPAMWMTWQRWGFLRSYVRHTLNNELKSFNAPFRVVEVIRPISYDFITGKDDWYWVVLDKGGIARINTWSRISRDNSWDGAINVIFRDGIAYRDRA